ncbi:cytochrome C [Campylobacter sputorum]|uniref:cytochrome C n=1 Tax=Campylobacter sputorum TaxID=206 RepID=UPI000B78AA05|nr:cytochrome C [Campylobacter sputorum]ASM35976.1 molybdopterin-containing oxidoreductase II, DMSO/TMAO/BSO reductase family, monoheme c-type cytochrome [Campylobacter sputorum bv. faecalis CCUG 20703]
MKKVLLVLTLLACGLFASETVYSNKVKSVYLSPNDTKVAGRLLPTNAINILEDGKKLVKFEIKGFVNPASPNIIYHSDGVRILALAFSKTSKPDIKIIKTGKDGAWNEVKVVAYTTKGDFEKDLKPMFEKASNLYKSNCSMCHSLHDVNQYNANQWPALFRSMVSRTPIEKSDHWLVIEYLQKHTTKK